MQGSKDKGYLSPFSFLLSFSLSKVHARHGRHPGLELLEKRIRSDATGLTSEDILEFLRRGVDSPPDLPIARLAVDIHLLHDDVFGVPLLANARFAGEVDSHGLYRLDADDAFTEVGLFAERDGDNAVRDHADGRVGQERHQRPKATQPFWVIDSFVAHQHPVPLPVTSVLRAIDQIFAMFGEARGANEVQDSSIACREVFVQFPV